LILRTQRGIIRTQHRKRGGKLLDIGLKIKTARLAKGMTQEELGDILGVQKSAVAKYENGRIVNIKRSTLKKISDVLDIPPFELVFNEEKPTEDGELSENIKKLVEFAKSVPEDKVDLVLAVMKSIVESD
jgi:transcriptional regulator with XRE-family HTH domain